MENQDEAPKLSFELPVDAMEMQGALYTLSRFFKAFHDMGSLIERNEKLPAFSMSINAFDKVDSI